MKCPYCQAEMQTGRLMARGGGGLHWLPEHEPLPRLLVSDKQIQAKKGLTLCTSETIGAATASAEVCMACNKIIIDVLK